MVLNITEAALSLGYRSRSTLQRLVRAGQLAAYRVSSSGREILLETEPAGLPTLRETVQALTQYRPDSPLWQQPSCRRHAADLAAEAAVDAAMAEIDAGLDSMNWADISPEWETIAEQLNAYLGPEWPAPPYSGDQTATMALCLDLAQRGESYS
jgi:hypothetical protein